MKDTIIYKTLTSNANPFLDVDYHLEALFKYPENEWFYPTNLDSDDYAICDSLSQMYLIQIKRTPLWHDASFRGVRVAFMYNKDLKFNP